jgi:hypothetical protein
VQLASGQIEVFSTPLAPVISAFISSNRSTALAFALVKAGSFGHSLVVSSGAFSQARVCQIDFGDERRKRMHDLQDTLQAVA